jgi:uncharacterized repeat protein (TIGR03803 family)
MKCGDDATTAGRLFGVMSRILATAAILLILVASSWATGREKILYSFQGGSDGTNPIAGLAFDAKGNLYGTTYIGGNGPCLHGCGIVFKLTPNKSGSWTETILHQFGTSSGDGAGPQGSLVFDKQGNLYGTTSSGGVHLDDEGTVFKLTPTKSGDWTETIIHNFDCISGNDGCVPHSNLVFDGAGNLYGTTTKGGGGTNSTFCENGCGTAFKLAPNGDGSWTESLIHAFPKGGGGTPDGQNPDAGLIIDKAGNLYGTTFFGGPNDQGIVYKLAPTKGGGWKESILFRFHGLEHATGGANPYGGLVMDKIGNLYGTTVGGGDAVLQSGVVFKLTPTQKGGWKETVIHNFPTPRYHDGELPYTGLLIDASGSLYGAALAGGGKQEPNCQDFDGCGVVYKLAPTRSGGWKESILYAFQGGSDGSVPQDDRLVMDASGHLYGTTFAGGTISNAVANGVVFEVQQ